MFNFPEAILKPKPVRRIELGFRITSYNILGFFSYCSDLRWNTHVNYIFKKVCKTFYSLRVLSRAGVDQANVFKVYLATMRPVSEYAVPVWHTIPGFLSDTIESVQKRALKIIFPAAETYSDTSW